MSSAQTPQVLSAGLSATQSELSVSDKRQRWLEVFLILVIALGNSFVASIYLMGNTQSQPTQLTTLRSLFGVIHESVSILLLIYVLSRRRLRLRDLSLRWSIRGVGIGVLIAFLAGFAYIIAATCLQWIHHGLYGKYALGADARRFFANPSMAALPFIILNPFFEELIVRAYLMTEISELTGSALLAVMISVLVQTSYHLYYGLIGALSVAFMFLVFAAYYALSRRALTVVVAHELIDLIGFIRLL
jgi:membrane protease YdiL (CAAX protease family)